MNQYTLVVSFNANGGSGAPSTQIFYVNSASTSTITVSGTVSSTKPTLSGYTFLNWYSSMGSYWGGSTISKTFTYNGSNQTYNVTLFAAWEEDVSRSTFGTVPSSVILNGSTEYTFNISKSSDADHHTVKFAFGQESLTYTNVDSSQAVTFPLNWNQQIPNSTSGQLVATLTTFDADGNQIGDAQSITVTAWCPSWVTPSLTITASRVNANATVNSWGILLQGYSAVSFTATAAGVQGSSVASISFSGAGVQTTGMQATVQTSVLSVTGAQTWTVTVTDTRGRQASQTYTDTVYAYTPPSISAVTARRCTSAGVIDEATGTYALFNGAYSYSDANSHNTLTQVIDSKLHTGSTWTTLASSYTSGTDAVLGGSFDADKTYDVRLTITDTLGNSASFSVFLASVSGFALGLKNDRARFGGVPTKAGLEIDWDTYANGKVFLGGNELMTELWSGSLTNGNSTTVAGISNYTLFVFRVTENALPIFAMKLSTSGGSTYIRGMGGYSGGASTETAVYVNSSLSGDTLTLTNCHGLSGSTRSAKTLYKIYGIL